jgi:hypothetical protein
MGVSLPAESSLTVVSGAPWNHSDVPGGRGLPVPQMWQIQPHSQPLPVHKGSTGRVGASGLLPKYK